MPQSRANRPEEAWRRRTDRRVRVVSGPRVAITAAAYETIKATMPGIADHVGDQDGRALLSRSFLNQPGLADAVEDGRKIRHMFGHPLDGEVRVEAAGLSQDCVCLVHPARLRVGG